MINFKQYKVKYIIVGILVLLCAGVVTGCQKNPYEKKLQGSYQAREDGLVGSDKYAGYWHVDIKDHHFSIYDNEAGNPGFSGKISDVTKKYIVIEVDMDQSEDFPENWKLEKDETIKLEYKLLDKVLKLTNHNSTLILDKD